MEILDLGLISYDKAWKLQEQLHKKRIENLIPDTLLLLEHPDIFTFGKRDCDEDILTSPKEIKESGVQIIKTNRGGRITYHGPGQLVGYFIFRVKSVRIFVSKIEQLCINVLDQYGIKGKRDEKYPGVWVGDKKIAAIGLHIHQEISQHGFALNVCCDLDKYKHIIPCGIKDRGVISIENIINKKVPIKEVKAIIATQSKNIFNID